MTTYVFPGQGSQIVGMSEDFYKNFAIAKNTLEEIEDYSKLNLKEIIFKDPILEKHLTKARKNVCDKIAKNKYRF